MRPRSSHSLLFASLFAVVPCACFDDSPEGRQAQKETGEAIDALGNYAGKKKDEVVAEMREALQRYDGEIAALKQQAAAKGGELKEGAAEALAALEGKAAQARDALGRLVDNREEVFQSLRDGAARSFAELKQAVNDARAKMND